MVPQCAPRLAAITTLILKVFYVSAKRQLAVVPKRRTAPPEERREQLILATIRSVADHGLADTTIATVAREAGPSPGHRQSAFPSKEAAADGDAALPRRRIPQRLPARRPRPRRFPPVAGLQAMVELDFRRNICSRDKLAVWFAFWGERKFRPTYRRICAERDQLPTTTWCASSARSSASEGGYADVDPALVADGLSALTDGLWLDLLVRPDSMSRERGKADHALLPCGRVSRDISPQPLADGRN